MISALVELIQTLSTCPARRLSISVRIWGLPVTNIRIPGARSRTSFSESRSLNRSTPAHSSRASMHINVGRADAIAFSIVTRLASWGLRPPIVLFCCWKALAIPSGIFSIPVTICFTKEPSVLVADCSFRAAKSK